MLHDQKYLALCHKLLLAGFPLVLVPGRTICRGFADVGFEEYLVLNESTMLSLNTGQKGPIPESYKEHFFPLLSSDEISAELFKRGFDISEITYKDQRVWKLAIEHVESNTQTVFEGRLLEEIFVKALLFSFNGEFNV